MPRIPITDADLAEAFKFPAIASNAQILRLEKGNVRFIIGDRSDNGHFISRMAFSIALADVRGIVELLTTMLDNDIQPGSKAQN